MAGRQSLRRRSYSLSPARSASASMTPYNRPAISSSRPKTRPGFRPVRAARRTTPSVQERGSLAGAKSESRDNCRMRRPGLRGLLAKAESYCPWGEPAAVEMLMLLPTPRARIQVRETAWLAVPSTRCADAGSRWCAAEAVLRMLFVEEERDTPFVAPWPPPQPQRLLPLMLGMWCEIESRRPGCCGGGACPSNAVSNGPVGNLRGGSAGGVAALWTEPAKCVDIRGDDGSGARSMGA